MAQVEEVFVDLGKDSYKIYIGRGLLSELDKYIPLKDRKTAIITDSNVRKLYAEEVANRYALDIFDFPAGERQKNICVFLNLVEGLLEKEYNRDGQVATFGGGVVGDMGGFGAAVVNRGIPFYQISTSLLSDVDSSIGGKTAVDFKQYKNKIGAFYQPKGVVIDLDTKITLPKKELINGLGEIIKYGVMFDNDFFEKLEQNISKITDPKNLDFDFLRDVVKRSCEIKAYVVSLDEKEYSKYRSILNYGHTIGHAIEGLMDYEMLHGFCVSIGMAVAGTISNKMGLLPKEHLQRHINLPSSVGLPVKIPKNPKLTIDNILNLANKGDKKAEGGKAKFVLVDKTGHVYLHNGKDYTGYIDDKILRESIEENTEN